MAFSFSGALKKIGAIVKEVALLQRPVTATAVAALVLAVIPGVNISAAALTAIIVGVGAAAATIEKFITKTPITPAP